MGWTIALGSTGLRVSRLAVGTGTGGWAGRSAQTDKGRAWLSGVLRGSLDLGVTFWDLADEYGSHPAAADALRSVDRSKVVIATKTTAKDHDACRADVRRFLAELGTDRLDIVLLHALSSRTWTRGSRGAMEALSEAKCAGTVKAVGVSVHSLAALELAAAEPWVEVILVRLNYAGVNMDGPVSDVLPLVRRAHAAGKGIYAMKVLGCGELAADPERGIRFALETGCVHALTIGPTEDGHLEGLAGIVRSHTSRPR